jgi:predicted methyltransferase
MLRLFPALLWLGLATCAAGCSGPLSQVDVGRSLISGRDGWQHPDRVIEALQIAPGEEVAEIGAGQGYWLPHLSRAVGAEGRVYAVEIDAELVRALEDLVARSGWGNVEVILAGVDDPGLPDGRIDLAMTSLTYHHIESRPAYFAGLLGDLAPGGRVAHLDDRPDAGPPFSWFQGAGHWSDPDRIVEEMAEAGYALEARYTFLPVQSFQVFVPREAATADVAARESGAVR